MVCAVQSNNNTMALPVQPTGDVRQKAQTAINTQLEQLINNLQEIQNTNNKQNTNTWLDEIKNFIQQNLIILLSSMAGISLLIGGIILSSRNKKTPEINKLVEKNNTVIPENSQETKLEKRIRIAKLACQDGNYGLHCQTMAPLNALRILKAIGDPRGINWNLEKTRRQLEALGKEAFSQNNWLNDGAMNSAGIIKSIVPAIIFQTLQIPFGEYIVVSRKFKTNGLMPDYKLDHNALSQLLTDLNNGKMGTFSYNYKHNTRILDQETGKQSWFGGHMRTVYGFKSGNSYNKFCELMQRKNQINDTEFQNEFNRLLPNIGEILCYEQDNRGENLHHHEISISELVSENGRYKSSDFTIIDGNPKERDITLWTISYAHSQGVLDKILLPNAKIKYQSLRNDEERMNYMLSRALDLGATMPEDDSFNLEYISAT